MSGNNNCDLGLAFRNTAGATGVFVSIGAVIGFAFAGPLGAAVCGGVAVVAGISSAAGFYITAAVADKPVPKP